jgi:hypothetical protein
MKNRQRLARPRTEDGRRQLATTKIENEMKMRSVFTGRRSRTTRTPTTEATTRLPPRATPTANRVEAAGSAHAHHEGRGS